ncbi:hypothetical protein BT96DRAFT_265670 [Gymnopus androsaceus JB14]|uniref:F-box domain-containing protein n=1 Tax=Gymnopus androsaceus JB14 TaxID=1447944 RepID=A0A6A4H4I8_9AGAR|nr:hypothetical protein BT96DRAFT_265670 [Gymnopus androsaceus JB14]
MSAPSTPPPRTTSLSYNNAFASTSYSTPRPNSPSPSSDFSIIGADEAETNDQADYSFWSYNTSTPYKGFGSLGRRAAIYSTPTLNYFASSVPFPSSSAPQAGTSSSLKSLFPRIWDVLISSPTKNIISTSRSPITSQTFTPLDSDIHRHSMFPSYAPRSHSPTPVNRLTKGKGRANRNYSDQGESVDYLPARHSISSQYSYINFSDLPPLDGEEGELIDVDDEACFLPADHFRYGGTTWRGGVKGSFSRARVVTGIDILSMLPTEVALHVLEFLASGCSYNPHVCPSRNSSFRASRIPPNPYLQETFLTPEQSLQNILICSLVSKTWRSLALDNSVWRTMFECKWGNGESGGGITKDPAAIRRYLSNRTKSMTTGRDKRLPALPDDIGSSIQSSSPLEVLSLNYFKLYQERLELDRRWAGTAFTKRVSAASAYSPSSSNLNLSPPASRSSSLTPMYAAEYAPSSTMTSSRSSLSASTMMGTLESRRSQPMPDLPSYAE